MSNPTSNFGWQMPTSTDLVTDLPADFEVFGQAVDSDFVDLLGGTTGQVLSKTSGTDLDFTWVAQSAGMTNPMTTTGDTIYSSSGSTPARLGIGSAGQVLTVASGIPSWASPAGGGKVLQVVQATYSTATTIASQTYTDTGLSISITPSSASSKVLLLVSQMIYWYREADEAGSAIRLMRDSTAILDNFGARGNFFHRFLTATTEDLVEHATQGSLVYLDSPATTSAITYKTQGRAKNTANVGTLICQESSTTSVIIAMEIGA